MRKLSARENRTAKMHLADYKPLDRKPQRGAIRPGKGLNMAAWLDDASRAGYYVGLPLADGSVPLR